jgi:hypothetical protein
MPPVFVRRADRRAAALLGMAALLAMAGVLVAGPAAAAPVVTAKTAIVTVESGRGHVTAHVTNVRFKDATGPMHGQSVTFTTRAGVGGRIRQLGVRGPIKVTVELFVRSHGQSHLDQTLALSGARVSGLTVLASRARVKLSFTTVIVSTG